MGPQWPPPEWLAPEGQATDPFLPPEGVPSYPTFAPNQPDPFNPTPESLPGFGIDPLVQPIGEQAQVLAAGPLENPFGPAELGPADIGGPIPDPVGAGSPPDPASGLSAEPTDARGSFARAKGEYEAKLAESEATYQREASSLYEKKSTPLADGAMDLGMQTLADAAELNKATEDPHTDPDRKLRSMSTMKRVGLGIAGALAGWLDVVQPGGNRLGGVLGMIKDELDRDLQAQMEDHKQKAFAVGRKMEMAGKYIWASTIHVASEQRRIGALLAQSDALRKERDAIALQKWAPQEKAMAIAAGVEQLAADKEAEAAERAAKLKDDLERIRAQGEKAKAMEAVKHENKKDLAPTPQALSFIRDANGHPVKALKKDMHPHQVKAVASIQGLMQVPSALEKLRTWARKGKGIVAKVGDKYLHDADYQEAKSAQTAIIQAMTPVELTGVLQQGEWLRMEQAVGVSPSAWTQSEGELLKSLDNLERDIQRRATAIAKTLDEGYSFDFGTLKASMDSAPTDSREVTNSTDDLDPSLL